MDIQLRQLMRNKTPPVNPDIVEGLAVKHMQGFEEYIDNVFRSVAKEYPPQLEYVNFQRCNPQEEYNLATRKTGNARNGGSFFDFARSDIYLCKFFFRFNGKDMAPRYMYLPFVGTAGTIFQSGTRYVMSPVLADRIFSIGVNDIFIRLLGAKFTVERQFFSIRVNDIKETVQVAWSMVHNKAKKTNTGPKTTLVHYLLAKYGFTETFKMFCNCVPVVGGPEINANTYPADKWVICASLQRPPKKLGKVLYVPTEIRVAVRIEDFTPFVKSMVAGFFYVTDYFPDRIRKEYIDNTRWWCIMLGHILFTNSIGDADLYRDISEHLESLDEYVDIFSKATLQELGLHCNDIYQLFAVIIQNMNIWLVTSMDKICSMWDKELSILYFVALEITTAINTSKYKLKAAAKKHFTEKEAEKIMNGILTKKLIFTSLKNAHCLSVVSYTGDNKFFKITSILASQTSTNRQTGRRNRSRLSDPAKRLHVSIPEVGQYSNLPKSEPTGRERVSPHLHTDERGLVLRNMGNLALLNQVQSMIDRDQPMRSNVDNDLIF